jgi:hypothetical protein
MITQALRIASLRRAMLVGCTWGALCLPAAAALAQGGGYVAGDFHNHTTGTDGSTSPNVIVNESALTYGLDWFAQSGHGGAYQRDLRFSDPEYDGPVSGEGNYWEDTVGIDAIKGDETFSSGYGCSQRPSGVCQEMWRWQSIQEFSYPIVFSTGKLTGKPVWQGYEWNVPGHEHCSVATIAGQFPDDGFIGDADALAQFEYCFDRADSDTSQGEDNEWSCETGVLELDQYIDPVSGKIPSTFGDEPGGHLKAVAGVTWLQQHYPDMSYTVYAHIERDGPYDPEGNEGYNIEHFRDFNNAGPDVAFGFEAQPGHQAQHNRGFGTSAFGGTKGGTGVYSANIGGLWDALLGEGRNWWFFASSDWHNRGAFGPFDTRTTNDFWPGEYQKDYVYLEDTADVSQQDIIDALRSGNSFVVQGDLIDQLEFVACHGDSCATMGETLEVEVKGKHRPTEPIVVQILVRDPSGANQCPYDFANPSLAQVGIGQPINEPVLDHLDLIAGAVTGKIDPSDPQYSVPANPTTKLVASWDSSNWLAEADGVKRMSWSVAVEDIDADGLYLRLRGTNMPRGTPNETDAAGNPLFDSLSDNIPCPDCPEHTDGVVDYDVEAWTDLWLYSNPIYVQLEEKRGCGHGKCGHDDDDDDDDDDHDDDDDDDDDHDDEDDDEDEDAS